MNKEEFGKRSLSRNPAIFSLLNKLNLVESIGSGIRRIKKEMEEAGLKPPKFEFGKFFAVILFRPANKELGILAGEKTTQKTTQKIISLIKENPQITRKELAKIIEISPDGIKYHLANLKKKGILKRTGGKKSGYWKIKGVHNE